MDKHIDAKEAMKTAIVEHLKQCGAVTAIELVRHVEGMKGEYCFEDSLGNNVIFWTGMSDVGIDALSELIRTDVVKLSSGSSIIANAYIYISEGAYLNLPIAKSLRKYKKPHWLPLMFWLREKHKSS